MELTAPMIVPSNPVSPEHAHTTSAQRTNCIPLGEKRGGPGSAARASRRATARSSSPSNACSGAVSRCFTEALSMSSCDGAGEVVSGAAFSGACGALMLQEVVGI